MPLLPINKKKCMNTIFILSYSEFIGVTSLWSVIFTKSCTHRGKKKKKEKWNKENKIKWNKKENERKKNPVYCKDTYSIRYSQGV